MRPAALFLPLLVLLGCASHPKAPARAEAPAPRTTTEVTQTTELTSAPAPSRPELDPRRILARVEERVVQLVDRCGDLQVSTDRYATTVHLSIDPSGFVRTAEAHGTNARIDACIAEVARGWTFDAAPTAIETNIPLVLERPTHHE